MSRQTQPRQEVPNPRRLVSLGLALLAAGGLACAPGGPGDGSTTGPGNGPGDFSVTLEWEPPTEDAQGHPLNDLEGFRIYHGTEDPLTRDNADVVEVGTEPRHTLTGLSAGLRHFAVTAVDDNGNESALSEVVTVDLGGG